MMNRSKASKSTSEHVMIVHMEYEADSQNEPVDNTKMDFEEAEPCEPGPSGSGRVNGSDDSCILLDDSHEDSIEFLGETDFDSDRSIQRGYVVWNEQMVSSRNIVYDEQSIYLENNNLLSESRLAELVESVGVENSLEAGSDKLDAFMTSHGILAKSSYMDLLSSCKEEVLEQQFLGFPNCDQPVNGLADLYSLFDAQCKITAPFRTKSKSRVLDDATFDYSNSGIIFTDGLEKVTQSTALTLNKRACKHIANSDATTPASTSISSETLKIRIPKALIKDRKETSPSTECNASEPKTLESEKLRSKNDKNNKLATDKRKFVVESVPTSKNDVNDVNDEPVEKKKKRILVEKNNHKDTARTVSHQSERAVGNGSVKKPSSSVGATMPTPSTAKTPLTFLDALSIPDTQIPSTHKVNKTAALYDPRSKHSKTVGNAVTKSQVHSNKKNVSHLSSSTSKVCSNVNMPVDLVQNITECMSRTDNLHFPKERLNGMLESHFAEIDGRKVDVGLVKGYVDVRKLSSKATTSASVPNPSQPDKNLGGQKSSADPRMPPIKPKSSTLEAQSDSSVGHAKVVQPYSPRSPPSDYDLADVDRDAVLPGHTFATINRPYSPHSPPANYDLDSTSPLQPGEESRNLEADAIFARTPKKTDLPSAAKGIPGLTPPRKQPELSLIDARQKDSPRKPPHSSPNERTEDNCRLPNRTVDQEMSDPEKLLSEIGVDLAKRFRHPTDMLEDDPADDVVMEPVDESSSKKQSDILIHRVSDEMLEDPADDLEEPALCTAPSVPLVSAVQPPDASSKFVPADVDDLEEPFPSASLVDLAQNGPLCNATAMDIDDLEEPSPCASPSAVQRLLRENEDSLDLMEDPADELDDVASPSTNTIESNDAALQQIAEVSQALISLNVKREIVDQEDNNCNVAENSPHADVQMSASASQVDDLEEPSPCASPSAVRQLMAENEDNLELMDDPADEPTEEGSNAAELQEEVDVSQMRISLNVKKEVIDPDYSKSDEPVAPFDTDYLEEPTPCGSPSAVHQLLRENEDPFDLMDDPADEQDAVVLPSMRTAEASNEVHGAPNVFRLNVKREIMDDGYENPSGLMYTFEDPADDELEVDKNNGFAEDDLAKYRKMEDIAKANMDWDPADEIDDYITLSSDDDSDIEIIEVAPSAKQKTSAHLSNEQQANKSEAASNVKDAVGDEKPPIESKKPLQNARLEDDSALMKMITSIQQHTDSLKARELKDVPQQTSQPPVFKPFGIGVSLRPKSVLKHLSESDEQEYNRRGLREIHKRMCGKIHQINDYSHMKGYTTASEQFQDNMRPFDRRSIENERDLQDKLARNPVNGTLSCIPFYRIGTVVNRLDFPFDKCDGLFWPVTQPSDAVTDSKEMDSADVINQMYNLSCYTHERQQMFLSDPDYGRWTREYKNALGMSDAQMAANGRFKHRIGYKRVDRIEEDDVGRDKDRANQEKEQKWWDSLPEEMVCEVDKSKSQRMKRDEKVCRSDNMQDHVNFHLIDEYSSHFEGGDRKRETTVDWISPPLIIYVPANDRRQYLCLYTNWINSSIYKYMEEQRFPDVPSSARIVRSAFRAAFCFQTQSSGFLCHPDPADMKLIHERRIELIALRDDMKKRNPIRLCDILRKFELRSYEYAFWPIIWDSLVSFFKKYPYVSQMAGIHDEIDKAFRHVAKVNAREAYFKDYSEKKKNHVEVSRRNAQAPF